MQSGQAVGTPFNDQYFSRLVSTTRPILGESIVRNLLGLLSKFFPIKEGRGKLSLDVGCGVGHVLKVLTEFGYDTYGTDISNYAVETARLIARDPNNVKVADATRLIPFNQRFDLITCFEVIEHVPAPPLLLFNCYSKLRAGGLLILSTPNALSPLTFLRGDPTHVNVHNLGYWKRLIRVLPNAKPRFFAVQYVPFLWKIEGKFRHFECPILGATLLLAIRDGNGNPHIRCRKP